MEDHALITHLSKYTNSQIAKATLLVTFLIGLFIFALRFYQILLIFLVAIIVGVALKPLVNRLQRLGLPKWIGALLIYAALLLSIVTALWFGIPAMVAQSGTVTGIFQEGYSGFLDFVGAQNYRVVSIIRSELPEELLGEPAMPSDVVDEPPTPEENAAMLANTMDNLGRIGIGLFSILVTVVLSFYWILEEDEIKQRLLLTLPSSARETVEELWMQIEQKVGSFLIGQSLLCLSIFVLSLIAYWIIGLPNALVLALFAGLMEAVPNIGPVIGAVPALLIALTISPITAVWVIVASIIIQQLENNLLFPRIMDRAVGVRPFVALLSLLGFTTLFGIVGAVLSIPIAAIVQIFLDYFLLNRETTSQQIVEGRDQASVLQYEASEIILDIRQQIRKKDTVATAANDQVEDSIESIALDLSNVLKTIGQPKEEGK